MRSLSAGPVTLPALARGSKVWIMKIRCTTIFSGNGITGSPGKILDVDNDMAKSLILAGYAEPVEVKKRTAESKKAATRKKTTRK